MTVNFTTWKGITDGQRYGIPDSVVNNLDIWYPMDEGSGTLVADSLDGVNITWLPETWSTGVNLYNGAGIDLENEDTTFESQTFDINGPVSFCVWCFNDGSNSTPFAIGNEADGSDYYGFRTQGDLLDVIVSDSGSRSSTDNVSSSVGDHVFAGIAIDNGSATLDIWNETQKVGSMTDSVADILPISNGVVWGGFENTNFYNDVVDAGGVAIGNSLSETQFEDIWNDTKPE